MTRDRTPYSQRRAWQAPEGYGFDADNPKAGYYRMALRSGGALCGIRIWYGQPKDPVTGELLDRSLRWQAYCNGDYIDLDRVWPRCARQVITQKEYDRYCNTSAWARENMPDSAIANPNIKATLMNTPLYF